jgi:hypothetical protein
MINKRVIPTDCEIFAYDGRTFATTQGTFTSPGFVYLSDLALPKFTLTWRNRKSRLTFLMLPASVMISSMAAAS